MANTENIEAKLCAYIDGDLDAAGRLEIEKHLAANPQHRGLIAELSKQRDLLRQLPRESAPEEILDALQSQMERSVLLGDADVAAESQTLKIQRWPQLMAMAAIVLLTVGLGVVIYMVLPRNGGGDASYALSTTRGARLDDGSASSTFSESASEIPSDPAAVAFGGSGALDVGGASALAKSSDKDQLVETGALSSKPAADEPHDALAVSPAAPATLAEEQADIFAPSVRARAGGEPAVALNDLLDAQNRLQNADLARQLKDAPGGLNDHAVFVVVNTADPSAARSEVTNYLESNRIAWDSVLQPMPAPLQPIPGQDVNLSRSQRVEVQLKSGPAQAGQQGAPSEGKLKAEARSSLAGAAGAVPERTDAASQAPQTPVESQGELSGVADATRQLARRSELTSNVTEIDSGLAQATTRPLRPSLPQQSFEGAPLQLPAGENRLIIARGMTKQQAAELSSNLSKQTTVQRAAVYEQRPLAELDAAPPLHWSRAPIAPTTASIIAPTTAPTTAPIAPPPALGETFAAAAPTTLSATRQAAILAAPATQEPATPATTTAPAPIPLALSEAESLTVARAATRPVAGTTVDERRMDERRVDERVDVVILVQDDVAPAEVLQPQLEVPATPYPAPEPTPTPAATTTQPAAAPSTQPAPTYDPAP